MARPRKPIVVEKKRPVEVEGLAPGLYRYTFNHLGTAVVKGREVPSWESLSFFVVRCESSLASINGKWNWVREGNQDEYSPEFYDTKGVAVELLTDYVAHRQYVEGLGWCYVA